MLLRENIYDLLRSDILACRFAPGDEMREQDLAERYSVSRQPVRDALLRLQREHLVTVQPRQGYRVTPISLSDARDLLRFRLALEPACVAEAIESAPDSTRTSSPTTAASTPRWPMRPAIAAWRRRCAT
jgi:DNA-binding GntR family transcriptional regulator